MESILRGTMLLQGTKGRAVKSPADGIVQAIIFDKTDGVDDKGIDKNGKLVPVDLSVVSDDDPSFSMQVGLLDSGLGVGAKVKKGQVLGQAVEDVRLFLYKDAKSTEVDSFTLGVILKRMNLTPDKSAPVAKETKVKKKYTVFFRSSQWDKLGITQRGIATSDSGNLDLYVFPKSEGFLLFAPEDGLLSVEKDILRLTTDVSETEAAEWTFQSVKPAPEIASLTQVTKIKSGELLGKVIDGPLGVTLTVFGESGNPDNPIIAASADPRQLLIDAYRGQDAAFPEEQGSALAKRPGRNPNAQAKIGVGASLSTGEFLGALSLLLLFGWISFKW
jgi:hypothetical protein